MLIAGPFWPWPAPKRRDVRQTAARINDSASNYLALPAYSSYSWEDRRLDVLVLVSDEEWERVFRREYEKAVGWKS